MYKMRLKQLNKFSPLILLLFLIPLQAYGQVAMTNIDIETTEVHYDIASITAQTLTIDGTNGLGVTPTDGTDNQVYNFTRTASASRFNVDWDTLSNALVQFTVTSSISDGQLDIVGTNLQKVEVDDVDNSFTIGDGIYNILFGAGLKLELFFEAPTTSTTGGGGGGPPKPQPLSLLELDMETITKTIPLGNIDNGLIDFSWNSAKELQVNEIIVDQTVIDDIRITIQALPAILEGDPDGFSTGNIAYSIQIPPRFCDKTTAVNCINKASYKIPFTVQVIHDNQIIRQATVLDVNVSQGPSIDIAIYGLFGAVAIIAYGLYKSVSKHKSGSKSPHKKSKTHHETIKVKAKAHAKKK